MARHRVGKLWNSEKNLESHQFDDSEYLHSSEVNQSLVTRLKPDCTETDWDKLKIDWTSSGESSLRSDYDQMWRPVPPLRVITHARIRSPGSGGITRIDMIIIIDNYQCDAIGCSCPRRLHQDASPVSRRGTLIGPSKTRIPNCFASKTSRFLAGS